MRRARHVRRMGTISRRALVGLLLASARRSLSAQQAPASDVARAVTPAADDTLRLDLAQSIALALTRATAVQVGREAVELSGAALLESYGRFLPDARIGTATYSESGTMLLSSTALRPSSAGFYGAAYGVSTSLNLFNGLRDREHLRAAMLERDGATASLARAQQQVAFDVTQAFFQVMLDRRLEAVARASLELSRTREQQLAEQISAGLRAPPDLFRQQAQTKFDESAVIDASNRVRADESILLRRIREAPMRPHVLVEAPIDTAPLDAARLEPTELLQLALRQRDDLRAAAARLAADGHEARVASGARWPKVVLGLDLLGSGRVFGHESINGVNQLTTEQSPLTRQLGRQTFAVASLGLSWDLFDRWRTRLDVERAAAVSTRDRLQAEDLRLQIEGEVQRAVDDYQAGTDRLAASVAALRAADEAYAAVQGRFDAGLATFVDVLSAQNALTQARALNAQAVIGLTLQKAVLRYVAGDPPK